MFFNPDRTSIPIPPLMLHRLSIPRGLLTPRKRTLTCRMRLAQQRKRGLQPARYMVAKPLRSSSPGATEDRVACVTLRMKGCRCNLDGFHHSCKFDLLFVTIR